MGEFFSAQHMRDAIEVQTTSAGASLDPAVVSHLPLFYIVYIIASQLAVDALNVGFCCYCLQERLRCIQENHSLCPKYRITHLECTDHQWVTYVIRAKLIRAKLTPGLSPGMG